MGKSHDLRKTDISGQNGPTTFLQNNGAVYVDVLRSLAGSLKERMKEERCVHSGPFHENQKFI